MLFNMVTYTWFGFGPGLGRDRGLALGLARGTFPFFIFFRVSFVARLTRCATERFVPGRRQDIDATTIFFLLSCSSRVARVGGIVENVKPQSEPEQSMAGILDTAPPSPTKMLPPSCVGTPALGSEIAGGKSNNTEWCVLVLFSSSRTLSFALLFDCPASHQIDSALFTAVPAWSRAGAHQAHRGQNNFTNPKFLTGFKNVLQPRTT